MPETEIMNPTDSEILHAQFLNQPASTHTKHWDALWKRGVTGWDRAGPSLALKDAITQNPETFGSPLKDGQRKRALVPGCGRGYDVLLLSSLGYDVYGLDASETAIAAARKQQDDAGQDPVYAAHDPNVGPGSATFLLRDFFEPDFLSETSGGDFDVIFDYTFLCALPPELRPAWAKRMSELLAPEGGRLVCLEWPLGKDPHEGGPPHGLTSALYGELLRRPGSEVKYEESGVVVESQDDGGVGEGGLKRMAHFMPERMHKAGQNRDYVSIWAKAEAS